MDGVDHPQDISTFYRDRAAALRRLETQVTAAFQVANLIRRVDYQDGADLADSQEITRQLHEALIEIKTALARTQVMADLEISLQRALTSQGRP